MNFATLNALQYGPSTRFRIRQHIHRNHNFCLKVRCISEYGLALSLQYNLRSKEVSPFRSEHFEHQSKPEKRTRTIIHRVQLSTTTTTTTSNISNPLQRKTLGTSNRHRTTVSSSRTSDFPLQPRNMCIRRTVLTRCAICRTNLMDHRIELDPCKDMTKCTGSRTEYQDSYTPHMVCAQCTLRNPNLPKN